MTAAPYDATACVMDKARSLIEIESTMPCPDTLQTFRQRPTEESTAIGTLLDLGSMAPTRKRTTLPGIEHPFNPC